MLNTTECPNLRDLGGIRTKNGMVKIKFLDRENFIFEEKNFYISKIKKIYKADVFRFSGNEIGYYIDDD